MQLKYGLKRRHPYLLLFMNSLTISELVLGSHQSVFHNQILILLLKKETQISCSPESSFREQVEENSIILFFLF